MDVKHFIPSEMLILSAGTIVGSGILDKTGKRKNNLSIALTPSTSVSQSGTRGRLASWSSVVLDKNADSLVPLRPAESKYLEVEPRNLHF